MTPHKLAATIRNLRERAAITNSFERILTQRGIWNKSGVWYSTQKEHWLGWLSEYSGPGYYGRKNSHRSTEYAYNHIVCPPILESPSQRLHFATSEITLGEAADGDN